VKTDYCSELVDLIKRFIEVRIQFYDGTNANQIFVEIINDFDDFERIAKENDEIITEQLRTVRISQLESEIGELRMKFQDKFSKEIRKILSGDYDDSNVVMYEVKKESI
jgi:hypothetical protein